jgi:hypothetical protein
LAEPPGFLTRWSQLKRAERRRAEPNKPSFRGAADGREPGTHFPEAGVHGFRARRSAAPRNDDPLGKPVQPPAAPENVTGELPALESLTKDSDFRAFMRPGVPEELRNQALRKLWGSDPVYANLDGLLEYGEDFAAPFRMAGVVATVYRVLEGMPDPGKPAESATETAAATPVPAASPPEITAPETPAEAPVPPIEQARADGIE